MVADTTMLWQKAKGQELIADFKKAHRLSAWGVLGLTTDGLPFLLTHPVAFRRHYWIKTRFREKVSRRLHKFKPESQLLFSPTVIPDFTRDDRCVVSHTKCTGPLTPVSQGGAPP